LPNPIQDPVHEVTLALVLTAQALQKEVARLLRPFDLTDAQFNVLMLLSFQAPDGWLSQATLGDMLLVSRPNVTGLIDRLEQRGLVERNDDPDDRRVKRIRMTTQGKKLSQKAGEIYFKRLHEIMDQFSE